MLRCRWQVSLRPQSATAGKDVQVHRSIFGKPLQDLIFGLHVRDVPRSRIERVDFSREPWAGTRVRSLKLRDPCGLTLTMWRVLKLGALKFRLALVLARLVRTPAPGLHML